MKEVTIRLISIFVTFLIFLGFFMLMREYQVPMPLKILLALVLIVVVDFVKSKIFRR